MYANTGDKNDANPEFKYDAKFVDSEITYEGKDDDLQAEYKSKTGTIDFKPNSDPEPESLRKIVNRLSKTWKKTQTSSSRILNNSKTLVRVSSLTDESRVVSLGKLNGRIQALSRSNSSVYTIIPKIQTAYGFADYGNINKEDLKSFDDDPTYLTTHKIGYESRDRYATGPETCNSYLLLSPVNHSEIPVDGDTLESSKKLKSGETLRVPLIYQFRMTDYGENGGKIFGKNLKETSTEVKNTKYANIIGIDIWTDRNALKPKQYDIIVYSTYGDVIETNTNRTKTSSTQTLINVGGEIVKKLDNLAKDSKTVSIEKNILTTRKSRSIK